MFFPLSFKKLKHRIRSPFTLLKNKISRKNRNNKQQHRSNKPDVTEQSTPIANSVALTLSTEASSTSEVRFPPIPISASGPAACARAVEYEQDRIAIEHGRVLGANVAVGIQVSIPSEPGVEELAVDVKAKEEAKADPIDVGEVDVVVDTKQGGEDIVTPEVLAIVCDETTLAKDLVFRPTHQDEEINQDVQIVSQSQVDTFDAMVRQIVDLPTTDNAIQESHSVSSNDNEVVKPLPIDNTVEVLQSVETDNGDEAKQNLLSQVALLPAVAIGDILTPPATPTRKATFDVRTTKDVDSLFVARQTSVNILTPPTTPRRRVTSNARGDGKDADILTELQASVRSREKKRIERERAEKERKERERELIAKKAKEVSEHGSLICDPEEKNHVLREVRSWRKQREASLKVNPEDEAKDASYRAAFANEEIMAELRNATQSRSQRAPCLDNLQEKRQLALEELYATRLQAVRV